MIFCKRERKINNKKEREIMGTDEQRERESKIMRDSGGQRVTYRERFRSIERQTDRQRQKDTYPLTKKERQTDRQRDKDT